MNRLHALIVSVVLAAAGIAGAIAATQTMQLGAASAAPAQTDSAALRARANKLNDWAKALKSTLAKRPPALPAVPQFGPVAVASYRAAAVPVAVRTAPPAARAKPAPKTLRREATSVRAATRAPRTSSAPPKTTQPPTTTAGQPTDRTPTTTPAAAPSPPPATTTTTPTGDDDENGDDDNGGGEPPDPPESEAGK